MDLSNDGAGRKNTEKLSANLYSTFSVQKLSDYSKNYHSKTRSIWQLGEESLHSTQQQLAVAMQTPHYFTFQEKLLKKANLIIFILPSQSSVKIDVDVKLS